jgi:hypothetical protein
MACTYDIAQSADLCFLEITEQPSGKLVRQLWLPKIKWEDKGDDDISLLDGYSSFFADIDNINGYATVAALIAFIEPLRAACSLIPPGGGGVPSTVNGAVGYTLETGIGATAAGLHGVSITNVGAANGTVLGNAIIPGQTLTWNCYYDQVNLQMRMLPSIAFDGTGTTLAINTFL